MPYLCTGTVPPHWADLVLTSATIQMYTEKQVGAWQSFPNMEIKTRDFSGKNQPLSTYNQNCEGVEDRTVLYNHNDQHLWVSFADQPGIEKEINAPIAVSDSF